MRKVSCTPIYTYIFRLPFLIDDEGRELIGEFIMGFLFYRPLLYRLAQARRVEDSFDPLDSML